MSNAMKQIRRAIGVHVTRTPKHASDHWQVAGSSNEVRVERSLSTFGGINLRGATVFSSADDHVVLTRESNLGATELLFSVDVVSLANGGVEFRLNGGTELLHSGALVERALKGWDLRG